MYVGIDIGATKTLIATFNEGELLKTSKIKTANNFDSEVEQIVEQLNGLTAGKAIEAIVVASRGEIDSTVGTITDLKQLGWKTAPIKQRLEASFTAPISVYHDTELAALAEAKVGAGVSYSSVLYVTLSSGVGTAVTINGEVSALFSRSGGGDMVLASDLKHSQDTLESKVSGPAIVKRFGESGYKLKNPQAWAKYGQDLALGLNNMIVMLQPDIVVLGGGVSLHLNQFKVALTEHLEKYTTSQWPLPPILPAKNIETAVVWGCYLKAESTSKGN